MSTDQSEGFIYRKLSIGLLCAFAVLAFFTIDDYGMGWDEITRWQSGDNKLNYYKEVFAAQHAIAALGVPGVDRYPGLFDLSLAWVHSVTLIDRFILGHWWSVSFGFVGVFSVWTVGRCLGGARLAFISALMIILVPSFLGHLFHNPKDIPFAAMYMFALAMMTHFSCAGRLCLRWALLLGLSIGFAMSTRVAGVVLYAYLFAVLLLMWFRQFSVEQLFSRDGFRYLFRICLFLFISLSAGSLVLMLWWPASHGKLFSAAGGTFLNLHSRAAEIPLLFRGQITGASEAPFYYVVWMLMIKLPIVHILGLSLAVYYGLSLFLRNEACERLERLIHCGPLLLGVIFPILYLSATTPALHNGIRHFLFVVLPLCVFVAFGLLKLWDALSSQLTNKFRSGAAVFASLLLLSPVLAIIQLHPYQYTFYNKLVGGAAGSYGRYETEYWFTSSKHALEWLKLYS